MSHTDVRLALRAKLLTLSVCTTGSMTLAATATGYTRASGSFVSDNFVVGQEITPAGFGANVADVIIAVTATSITTKNSHAAEVAASGRSLSVLLPTSRAFENVDFTPVAGVPFVEEQYAPGGAAKVTLGPLGEIEALPLYFPRVYVPSNTGFSAASRYADALVTLFAPDTDITMTAPSTLRVRTDLVPSPGQLLQAQPGFAVLPVTVPLRYRTPNSI